MLDAKNLILKINDQAILNGLSFEIKPGQRVGLIGPNGSGKTTLFNCLSGFNNENSGDIIFNDRNLKNVSPSQRARMGLGRLFQNFGIFRDLTVEENLLVALESKQPVSLTNIFRAKSHFRNQILDLLRKVDLEDKARLKAGSLSGGQLRLLEIIRLIAFGAKVFLLDEPTAGVSPKMKIQILNALHSLIPNDAAVLLIEHDINFIQNFCERVLVLDTGKVVLDGPISEVRSDPRLQEIYFGTKENSGSI